MIDEGPGSLSGGQVGSMMSGPGMITRQQQDETNQRPQYSMPGILHFLQTEWARFEMERSQWEVERAELQVNVPDREELGDVIQDERSFRNDESPDQSMEDNNDPDQSMVEHESTEHTMEDSHEPVTMEDSHEPVTMEDSHEPLLHLHDHDYQSTREDASTYKLLSDHPDLSHLLKESETNRECAEELKDMKSSI